MLIKACFDPLSYNIFLNPHPIVNKKKFSTSSHSLSCHNNLNMISQTARITHQTTVTTIMILIVVLVV